jgi:hypothetical protein
MLLVSFRPGSQECSPTSAFSSEDRLNIIKIPLIFEIFRNTLHMWDVQRTKKFLL